MRRHCDVPAGDAGELAADAELLLFCGGGDTLCMQLRLLASCSAPDSPFKRSSWIEVTAFGGLEHGKVSKQRADIAGGPGESALVRVRL